MPKPFKLEVFDGDITYRSHSVISGQAIYFDYLTLEKTTINSPIITVAKGDYAHITDFDGAVIYQGIIDDYQIQDKTMSIVLRPLLSLLDCSVVYDRTDLATGSLEAFIAGIITDKYINNADTLQNITGLTVGTTSTTNSAKLNLKSNVHEFYDIITKALTLYGIVVTAELLPQTKKLNVSIGTVSDAVTIEAKLYNVISKNIVVANSLGGLNKIKLINKNNEAETVTYYLHSDETISTTNADRITPVVERIEYVESDDFSANAEQRATAALTPQTNNNLIEIELATSNKLVDAASMKIGTTATIIDDATYNTVLTGFEKSENITKLVFGIVRLELTKKLIMQKRADSDSATYVTVAEVPATGKALSGADNTIISGTKGTSGNLAEWNADGDLVDSGVKSPLSSDLALYVATTGSDTTGDGSSGNPYASVQRAVDRVPKNLNGYTATINVASGTYSGTGETTIKYFFGGKLLIVGNASTKPVFASTFTVDASSAIIYLQYLQWQSYTTCAIIVRDHCFVSAYSCVIDGGGTRNGIQKYGGGNIDLSVVVIKNCTTGIYKGAGPQGGEVTLYSVSGTGNTTAANVSRYTLRITYDVTISGSYAKSYGGLIINANGTLG